MKKQSKNTSGPISQNELSAEYCCKNGQNNPNVLSCQHMGGNVHANFQEEYSGYDSDNNEKEQSKEEGKHKREEKKNLFLIVEINKTGV